MMPQKPERPVRYKNIIDEFYEGGDDARPDPDEPDDTEREHDTDANAVASMSNRESSTDGTARSTN